MIPPSLSILTEGIVGFTAETNRNSDLFHSSALQGELVSASSKLLVVSQLCGGGFVQATRMYFSVRKGLGIWGNAMVVKT